MIGLPEILIVALIVFLLFGGYKRLPQIGRSAGKGLRIGGEKAKEIADSAEERVGDKFDAEGIGRSAGKGARELREVRDALKGTSASAGDTPPRRSAPAVEQDPPLQPEPRPERPAAAPAEAPAASEPPDPPAAVEPSGPPAASRPAEPTAAFEPAEPPAAPPDSSAEGTDTAASGDEEEAGAS